MNQRRRNLNRTALLIFAPLLIISGIAGFILPSDKGMMSATPAYNIFHIIFGSLGLLLALGTNYSVIRAFNIIFGLLDLYQVIASFMHLFPESFFHWKTADDIVHVVIGIGLIAVGMYGDRRQA